MNHNLSFKYSQSALPRGPEDYRLHSQNAYLTGFSPLIPQQNSTHDMNKSLPAGPAGMYQQSTGAIPGPTQQHHQPGIGGPSPNAIVQGQQQISRAHIANMAANFQPRNNPQMPGMTRPPMASIVGGSQGSQGYQPIQNVMVSHHGHPQLFQHFPQLLYQQQRSMQYPPIQQCPPQTMYTSPFYNSTPAAPNPAYYQLSCPPAVNNMAPQSQQTQKREKKIIQIIDPDTGKNIIEEMANTSSRDSSRSSSIQTSRENSRAGGSNPDIGSVFATQVAAKIKIEEPENKIGIGEPQPQLTQSPDSVLESHDEDPDNDDISTSVICDSYNEKVVELENSNISFSKCDRLDSNSISDNMIIAPSEIKPDFEPVENESYNLNLVNHGTYNSAEDPPQEYSVSSQDRGDLKPVSEIPIVSKLSQENIEILNCSSVIEDEPVSNCVEETVVEPTDISPIAIGADDTLMSHTAANEKAIEGKKAKGKKKKDTINKKGETKEGSDMDAFLGASDSEPVAQVVPSPPASVAPVPAEEIQGPTSSPTPEPITNHDVAESNPSLNENEPIAQDSEEYVDVKETSVDEIDSASEISLTNSIQDASKCSLLKYSYKEDQWSPLNPEGKKHYDREFLIQMQAQPISLKKPSNLPNLDVIKDKAQIYKLNDVNRAPVPPMTPRMFVNDPFMPQYARGGITRPSPHGGVGRRSQQGRDKPKKVISFSSSLNQAVKLHESSNAWKPQSVKVESESDEDAKNEEVYKKVRGILNKLTPQKFETLVKQVKELEINTEERLKNVIDLVFDKAVDEPNFSVPYANMCKQLALVKVPLSDQEGFVNFRKLLLTKCQKEFEQDRNEELNKVEKVKQIAEATTEEKKKQLMEDLEEEERKSRRRQLGNIRFIGELFKMGMLTELIMHECVKKLLFQGDEDSLECLCRLLTTIGKELEIIKKDPRKSSDDELHAKKSQMNEYISHMQRIVDKRQTSSRVRFMLQDVIDLRKSSWVPRRNDENPKTIDQIHKEAEREAHEQQQLLQNMSFPTKRPPDSDRKRSTGRNMNFDGNADGGGWMTTSSKNSKLNLDVQKLTLSKPMAVDTMTLGPGGGRGYGNWGRGSSGGNKGTMEPDRSSTVSINKYSVLANESMPLVQGGMEARRNSQRSAASSRESSRGRNSQLPPQSLRKTPSTSKERENILETVSRITRPQPEQKPVEPKVPNMSNVNGKETSETNVALKGPELPEDKIEERTRPLMDEFLHNVDFKEAIRCITELASPSTIHLVITAAINHVLERSSQARYFLGQLLHTLVQSNIVTMDQYNIGVKSILELVDDYALDIPLIRDYLAEILEPMTERGDIPLTFLIDTLQPCSPSLTAAKLVVGILHCASKKRGTIKVGELWRESDLKWTSFLPTSENVADFVKTHNVEFTMSQRIAQPIIIEKLSGAEIQKELDFYLRNTATNNEQIFDWIESHVGDRIADPTFIRALVTVVLESVLTTEKSTEKYELDTEKLKSRMPILQHYIDGKDAELQALYALQALLVRLKQPKGILSQMFDTLYDEEVICEDTFYLWEKSDDPSEQEGKGVAVNSVNPFFTWLKEADNDESADNEESAEDG